MPPRRSTWSIALATAVCCASVAPAGAADGDARRGIAVAPMRATGIDEGPAALLTGIAEGLAMQRGVGGRFVAHGELLRAVDAGDERGCRDEGCLARAAATRGAGHLLTSEVGRLDDLLVLSVQLLTAPDARLVASVSRQCDGCDTGSLPALLHDAMGEALGALSTAASPASGDGRTIVLGQAPLDGAFHYRDRHRNDGPGAVEVEGVALSTQTLPDAELGCAEPGAPLRFHTHVLAHNLTQAPVTLDGTLRIELFEGDDEEPLVAAEYPLRHELAAVEPVPEGAAPVPVGDDDPASVLHRTLVTSVSAARPRPMRLTVAWEGTLLEELTTRPVARVAQVGGARLVHDGAEVDALTWGEPMELRVALTKDADGAEAEVTVQVDRQLRYWYGSEGFTAHHRLPADATGAYELVVPFVPGLEAREATRGYRFEVWVNGCSLHRTPIWP